MMGDSNDMEIVRTEDTEGEFLQAMSRFDDDNLDQSTESLLGSVKLPLFSMDQSTGTELQGSQGFQVLGGGSLTLNSRQDGVNCQNVYSSPYSSGDECLKTRFISVPSSISAGMNLSGSTLIFSHNQIGPLDVINSENQFQILNMQSAQQDSNCGLLTTVDYKPDFCDPSVVSEVYEGGSSDEKSGKCKISPKRRGRKSRSSSSAGNEMSCRSETGGPSPSRLEGADGQSGGEMGFRPSLLDEILTEKKLALMKSSQVIHFLQAQQKKLAREKKVMCGQQGDT